MEKDHLINLIKASLWGTGSAVADSETFEEMKKHAIYALPAEILSTIDMSAELRSEWKNSIVQHIMYYAKYINEQSNIPISIPYVILKGTSAAKYYPYPQYRCMGDIDIITRREDFDVAFQDLVHNGYHVIKQSHRECSFKKNGIIIELHRYFASLNNPNQSQYLDDLIIQNITADHVLPDLVNGLVLLEHISQHLENGLGLRHIIDWMMFVDKCLPDDRWEEFKILARNVGLEKLAIITTNMCVSYLGLSKRNWCADIEQSICEQLFDYVLSCGNFGCKWTDDSDLGKWFFSHARGPISTFKLLQERGRINWKATQKYRVLRPFAWIYQMGKYFIKGFGQNGSLKSLFQEYKEANKRVNLFYTIEI